MAGTGALKVEGTVVEVLPHALYRVELANGHRVLAHFPRRTAAAVLPLGRRVTLEMSPFDLSKGRIVGHENEL